MRGSKKETLDWLYGLIPKGMKLGLEQTGELLRRVDNPQRSFDAFHVSGTDGKGSVCAMLHSVLSETGREVGLYTSPHLVDFNERVSVAGRNVTDGEIVDLASRIAPSVEEMASEGMDCTFFEVTTAMAFMHFQDLGIETAVVEVGMGGRLDSTNIVNPVACAITKIGLEHTEYLGDTLEKIAWEKAGIIKRGVPVATFRDEPALSVISGVAEEVGAPLSVCAEPEDVSLEVGGTVFTLGGRKLRTGIPGRHQARNASLAIETLLASGYDGVEEAIPSGLEKARLSCRMEKVNGLPLVLDVTHTANGSAVLAEDFLQVYGRGLLVLGLLSDKDLEHVAANLSRIADKAFVASPSTLRAMPVERLLEAISPHCETVAFQSIEDALSAALSESGGKTVLTTGSFHVAEEAIRWLRKTYPQYWTR